MARVQFRRDSKTNWGLYNPILADGEIGIEKDTKRFKLGDGINTWDSLSYSSKSLADSPKEYISSLSILGIEYDPNGNIVSITYEGGHKQNFTYLVNGSINTVVYTDTDGVSVLVTETYNYTNNLLVSITKS